MWALRPPRLNERVLLNLSGGLDSAYCLWRLLEQGYRVLVHHIRLTNNEGRQDVEDRAVERILSWMRDHNLRDFHFVRSGFDYGTIRHKVRDIYVWSFMTGVILADPKYRDITGVVIPRHANSYDGFRDPIGKERDADEMMRAMLQTVARPRRHVEFLFPIRDMPKADVVRALPASLLVCCWWCRRPVEDQSCGRCLTCRQVEPVLQERKDEWRGYSRMSRYAENGSSGMTSQTVPLL